MKTFSTLIVLVMMSCCAASVNATTRTWVGAATGGTASNLANQNNWSPVGVPAAGDSCIISYSAIAGGSLIFNLPTSSSLNIGALTIILSTPAGATAGTALNFNIYNTLAISGAFTIVNTSSSAYNDSVYFNIGNSVGNQPGTVTCGSMGIIADGKGNSSTALPVLNLTVNKSSFLTCNGSWTSTAAANSYTGTYILNYGTIVINGFTSATNYGTKAVRYLVGDTTTTVTFNGNTKFGVAGPINAQPQKDSSLLYTGLNQVYIGGVTAGSKGNFIFKGMRDTLGFNFGMENLKKGTILFDNPIDTQIVTSYAGTNAPDRIPGTFQVGSTNNPIVTYELGAGDNDALTISYALIVNTNATLSLSGVVTPSNANNIDPDGLVQIMANAKLSLLTKAGKTSGVPGNYKYYNFDRSSTLEFNGKGYQTLYSGIEYGNVIISGSVDSAKTAGGSLIVKGSLTINSGRTLNARFDTSSSESIITVQGNWINNGTFNAYNGTVILDSANDKSIGGTKVTTFNKLVMNKDGKSMRMDKDVIVNDSLKLDSGQLKINGKTLTLNGAVTHKVGSLTGNDSSNLALYGSAVKNIYFTPGNNTFKNVTVNAGASNVYIDDSLTIGAGTFLNPGIITVNGTLNTGNMLTLKSGILGDARVGISSGTISGEVTVERYIPARRAWRFMSVPFISSSQTIQDAWQEGATPNPNIYTRNNPKPGYGTQITYWHGGQANGFDENLTANPSLYSWDPSAGTIGNWAPVTSTKDLLTNKSAYYLFVRGDRSIDLSLGTGAGSNNTILRSKGVLNEQNGSDVTYNLGDYPVSHRILVSNPYASPIDISGVLSLSRAQSNITPDKFWVWDPTFSFYSYPYNVGYYITYVSGIQVPFGNYLGGKYAQSGQAFMVESAGTGNASITFKQTDKVGTSIQVFGLQSAEKKPAATPVIYTNLINPALDLVRPVDGVGAGFGRQYSDSVTREDAGKMWNQNESMALWRQNQGLAIEFRPIPKQTDTLFYKLYLYMQPYRLKIFSANLPGNLPAEAWLVDKYLGTQTAVDLYDTTWYSFTPNPDTNSYRNRFMLVFNRTKKQDTKAITSLTSVESVTVFPNPVTGETVKLQFKNMPLGDYDIIVFNAKGEQLLTRELLQSGGNAVYTLKRNANWKAGLYTISVINRSNKKVNTIQMIVNR